MQLAHHPPSTSSPHLPTSQHPPREEHQQLDLLDFDVFEHSSNSDLLSSPANSPRNYLDFDLFVENLDDVVDQSAFDFASLGSTGHHFVHDATLGTRAESNASGALVSDHRQNTFGPNSRVRLQQHPSLPPAFPSATPPPMHEGSNWIAQQPQQPQQQQSAEWAGGTNEQEQNTYLSPQTAQFQYYPARVGYRTHQRLPSESSVGSTGPDSPYPQTPINVSPRIVDPDSQSTASPHFDTFDASQQQAQQYSKALAAQFPTLAINSPTFVNPALQNLRLSSNAASYASGQTAMRQVMSQQRDSFGGMGNSRRRDAPMMFTDIPKLDRTVSDVYQDELFDSSMANTTPSHHAQSQQQYINTQGPMLSPYRTVFSDRLQQANSARSASSSVASISRERSPFREDSEYSSSQRPTSAVSGPGTASSVKSAAQLREQHKMQENMRVYAQHNAHPVAQARPEFDISPKTISPKEALLDAEDAAPHNPAFASAPAAAQQPFVRETASHRQRAHGAGANVGAHSAHAFANGNSHGNMQAIQNGVSSQPHTQQQQSNSPATNTHYTFMPPSVPTPGGASPQQQQQQQQYPFMSHLRRQSSSMRSAQSDAVPEFPASFTSMESTRSEPAEDSIPTLKSQETSTSDTGTASPLSRPSDTSASSGPYSCPACPARFDSAARLQKHRRDSHAQPTSPLSPSTATSRNNAPGPHKCTRVNPSTGKPCNTIFSRSYDLTRHEETIHSGRKTKVRCHLCREEKTFSRSDALTRHLRVVHPGADVGGRRRRG